MSVLFAPVAKYTNEVTEVIWALLCEGIGPTEIRRRLATNSAGVGYPVEMPKSTMAEKVAALKKARGHPHSHVKPGDEGEAALAIVRRSLEALARAQLRLIDKEKRGEELTSAELKNLGVIGEKAASLRTRVDSATSQRHSKAAEHKNTVTSELLARLGEQMRDEGDSVVHARDSDAAQLAGTT